MPASGNRPRCSLGYVCLCKLSSENSPFFECSDRSVGGQSRRVWLASLGGAVTRMKPPDGMFQRLMASSRATEGTSDRSRKQFSSPCRMGAVATAQPSRCGPDQPWSMDEVVVCCAEPRSQQRQPHVSLSRRADSVQEFEVAQVSRARGTAWSASAQCGAWARSGQREIM